MHLRQKGMETLFLSFWSLGPCGLPVVAGSWGREESGDGREKESDRERETESERDRRRRQRGRETER